MFRQVLFFRYRCDSCQRTVFFCAVFPCKGHVRISFKSRSRTVIGIRIIRKVQIQRKDQVKSPDLFLIAFFL